MMEGLSIFFSTRKLNEEYLKHIKDTIGVKNYEINYLVNDGTTSLTKAYNEAINNSKYRHVCLIHDDLFFNINNWGKRLLERFNESEYGILGIAGTTVLPESGRWWENPFTMVGTVKHSKDGKTWESRYSNVYDFIIEVVAIDGLFIALDKERIKFNFDEEFLGFHFYEIPWCVKNYIQGCKIGVTFDIKVTHRSIGATNESWETNRALFSTKYKENLPLVLKPEIHFDDSEVLLEREPKLRIIILSKGKVEMLKNCVTSIIEKTKYKNYKIIIGDTGSSADEKHAVGEFIAQFDNVDLVEFDYYNFAENNNEIVEQHIESDSELLLFCNNDIVLLNDAIGRMVRTYIKKYKKIGTVGARLYYEDNTIQHAGMLMWLDNRKNIQITHKGLKHPYRYSPLNENVVGNTAAFMLISKALFDKIGGFNENYQECFEDVELNIKCLKEGKTNIFVSDAVCYHLESQSRKREDKLQRLQEDYKNNLFPLFNESLKDWKVRQYLQF